jgi:hypothetical protein
VTARPSLIIGVSILLGCLVLGWLLAPNSAGQAPAAAPKGEARYQTIAVGNYIVVSDPATGECWTRIVQAPELKNAPEFAWVSLGTPIRRK